MRLKLKKQDVDRFLKRLFYKAYLSSSVLGMGILQQRPNASEDDVWQNVQGSGDYAINWNTNDKKIRADYVFGRMMKLDTEKISEDEIEITPDKGKPDYQSWCRTYPTTQSLCRAVAQSLDIEIEIIETEPMFQQGKD